MKKTVTNGNDVTVTDYISGFQYVNEVLEFFPTSEGYVKHTPSGNPLVPATFNYVYNYTDHLGNIRLSYTLDPQDNVLKILEENHYYPFGLKHKGYLSEQNIIISGDPNVMIVPYVEETPQRLALTYKYKFLGQERQDELGLNWDTFRHRNYDYAIGRFICIDPIAEDYVDISTYQFAHNSPVWKVELEGLEGINFQELGDRFTQGFVNTVKSAGQSLVDAPGGLIDAYSNITTNPSATFEYTVKHSGPGIIYNAIVSQTDKAIDNVSNAINRDYGALAENAGVHYGDAAVAAVTSAAGAGIGRAFSWAKGQLLSGITESAASGTGEGAAAGTKTSQKLIGPAGDPSANVTKQIPGGWEMKSAKKGAGTRFVDPNAPKANNARAMQGNPNSPNPSQKVNYVKRTKNGTSVDVNGNPAPSNTPEAHIPNQDFKFN